jgi:hypothetical protein
MPLIALGVMGIVGSVVGAVGASKAAGAQANAAKSAAQLQHEDQQASLAFQKQEWATQQQNMAPWLSAGKQALGTLSGELSTPGQGLLENFQAPTGITEQNDPGFQARLKTGADALQNSAAARGGLLSGNTAKALEDYSQTYASNEYGNVYNRAFNTFEANKTNEFNRLSSLAGTGQQAATTLGQEGSAAAGNVTNINAIGGAQQGGSLMAAGNARASGYAGVANAITGGIGNIQRLMLLSQMGLINPVQT